MKTGLMIDGVSVPYEVEAEGPDAVDAYIADPDAWHEERKERKRAEVEGDLRDALEKMSGDQLAAHAGSLGISVEKGSGKGGAVLKADWVGAIVDKQIGG
ncbi:MAG: hypothetical protein LC798_13470 [Chloroflexi bacterium]|nr:hypothetical protein [Chloroflexota bacterium]